MEKTIIYSNIINEEDFEQGYNECCKICGINPDEGDFYSYIADVCNEELDNVYEKLNFGEFNILVSAELHLETGKMIGCAEYTGFPLSCILDAASHESDYFEVYVEGWDVKARKIHGNMTDYYTFRLIVPDKDITKLTRKLNKGEEVTYSDYFCYSESLVDELNKIYGWFDEDED